MLIFSFSIAEKETKKLVQKKTSVKQFLDRHPAQILITRCVPFGQHLGGDGPTKIPEMKECIPEPEGMGGFLSSVLVLLGNAKEQYLF